MLSGEPKQGRGELKSSKCHFNSSQTCWESFWAFAVLRQLPHEELVLAAELDCNKSCLSCFSGRQAWEFSTTPQISIRASRLTSSLRGFTHVNHLSLMPLHQWLSQKKTKTLPETSHPSPYIQYNYISHRAVVLLGRNTQYFMKPLKHTYFLASWEQNNTTHLTHHALKRFE